MADGAANVTHTHTSINTHAHTGTHTHTHALNHFTPVHIDIQQTHTQHLNQTDIPTPIHLSTHTGAVMEIELFTASHCFVELHMTLKEQKSSN